jgi:tetratricopeptide (TPR) repeat protein
VRRTYVTIRLILAGLFVAGAAAAQSVVDDPAEVFRGGNASYEAGEYAAAIEAYRRLTDAGVVNADLYYNLGNAYYKNNELGPAVLFYVRALRIEPRNDEATDNLALVRSQLRDKQFVQQQNRLLRGFIWLHNNLSTTEMLVFASGSYVFLCLLLIVFIFRNTPAVVAAYRRVSVLSPGRLVGLARAQDLLVAIGVVAALLLTSGISAYRKLAVDQSEAVVLAAEVAVFSSPTDDATLQFKIHEGTMVTIRDRRAVWTKIALPGGMSGWVATESIEKV